MNARTVEWLYARLFLRHADGIAQRFVVSETKYCDVEWTEDDIHAACELFKEKLGFVPVELDMLLQNTVEYLTVGDNQINVRTPS